MSFLAVAAIGAMRASDIERQHTRSLLVQTASSEMVKAQMRSLLGGDQQVDDSEKEATPEIVDEVKEARRKLHESYVKKYFVCVTILGLIMAFAG